MDLSGFSFGVFNICKKLKGMHTLSKQINGVFMKAIKQFKNANDMNDLNRLNMVGFFCIVSVFGFSLT